MKRSPLTDQCRRALLTWVLTPRQRAIRLDDLAADLEVSRTPIREAVRDLDWTGLMSSAPYQGVKPLFTGRDDLRHRVTILAAAAEAGFPPAGGSCRQRISSVVGGQWGAVTWDLIAAWPDLATGWGIDLRPAREALLEQAESIRSASSAVEVSSALRALRDLY